MPSGVKGLPLVCPLSLIIRRVALVAATYFTPYLLRPMPEYWSIEAPTLMVQTLTIDSRIPLLAAPFRIHALDYVAEMSAPHFSRDPGRAMGFAKVSLLLGVGCSTGHGIQGY